MGSSPADPRPAATPDLDLAFSADPELEPALLQAGGAWLDPLTGAELWQGLLSGWLAELAAELPAELQAPAYSLGLSLVGDAGIAELNAQWRGQPGPTDVLAFAALEAGCDDAPPLPLPPPAWSDGEDRADAEGGQDRDGWHAEPLELGDIVISVDTAGRQAGEHGHGLERELRFLASHGLLHLLGWDHPDEASLTAMLARQERLLDTPGQPG